MAASKNDFLAELAKKPPKTKLAILAGIIVLGGALYYQFFYSGLVDDKGSAMSQKQRLQSQRDKLVKQLKDRKKLIAEKRLLDKEVERMQKALPTEAELPAFFEHLQHKAGDAQVSIKSWKRQSEKPLGSFIRVPVKVAITGNYHQIMHYFSLLGPTQADPALTKGTDGLDKAPVDRIVTIESLNLSGANSKNDEIILQASFVASTFRKEEAGKKKRTRRKKPAESTKGKGGKLGAANRERSKALDKAAGTKPGMTGGAAGKPGPAGVNRLKNPGAGVPK